MTLQVAAGTREQVEPPLGFTATDLYISFRTRRVKLGPNGLPETDADGNPVIEEVETSMNVDDPPGGSLPEIQLLAGVPYTRLYTYIFIGGGRQFGPVTATVPVALDGFETNDIPRLFAAEVDSLTGEPVVNQGPGHCLTPTSTRVNDPATGELLPQFVFNGPTTVIGWIGDPARGAPLALLLAGAAILLALIVWILLRRATAAKR